MNSLGMPPPVPQSAPPIHAHMSMVLVAFSLLRGRVIWPYFASGFGGQASIVQAHMVLQDAQQGIYVYIHIYTYMYMYVYIYILGKLY